MKNSPGRRKMKAEGLRMKDKEGNSRREAFILHPSAFILC
jgi:hypothetical protein